MVALALVPWPRLRVALAAASGLLLARAPAGQGARPRRSTRSSTATSTRSGTGPTSAPASGVLGDSIGDRLGAGGRGAGRPGARWRCWSAYRSRCCGWSGSPPAGRRFSLTAATAFVTAWVLCFATGVQAVAGRAGRLDQRGGADRRRGAAGPRRPRGPARVRPTRSTPTRTPSGRGGPAGAGLRAGRQGRAARLRRELRPGGGAGHVVLRRGSTQVLDQRHRSSSAAAGYHVAERLPHLADVRRRQLAGALQPAVRALGRQPAALPAAARRGPAHADRACSAAPAGAPSSTSRPTPRTGRRGRTFYGFEQLLRLPQRRLRRARSSATRRCRTSTRSRDFRRRELAPADRPPVMAEIDLISSHHPWTPLPRMVPWDQVGDGSVFDGMPEQGESSKEVFRDPEAVKRVYGESVEYSWQALTSFLTTYNDPNLVLVVLGDHQPHTYVSGEHAGHDVPDQRDRPGPGRHASGSPAGAGRTACARPRTPPSGGWTPFRDRFLDGLRRLTGRRRRVVCGGEPRKGRQTARIVRWRDVWTSSTASPSRCGPRRRRCRRRRRRWPRAGAWSCRAAAFHEATCSVVAVGRCARTSCTSTTHRVVAVGVALLGVAARQVEAGAPADRGERHPAGDRLCADRRHRHRRPRSWAPRRWAEMRRRCGARRSSSSPPAWRPRRAPIATVAAAATRPAVIHVRRRRWCAGHAAHQRGQQGVGDRHRQLLGVEDLDRHPGQQAGQPGELADRLRALGAARQVPLEGDPVLGGEGAQDVGAVLVLVRRSRRCALMRPPPSPRARAAGRAGRSGSGSSRCPPVRRAGARPRRPSGRGSSTPAAPRGARGDSWVIASATTHDCSSASVWSTGSPGSGRWSVARSFWDRLLRHSSMTMLRATVNSHDRTDPRDSSSTS